MKLARLAGGLLSLAFVLSATAWSQATSYDTRFVVALNDGAHYDVTVQVKGNGGTFALGTSNFIFSFDDVSLSAPTLQAALNFSGGAYATMALAGAGNSRSVNIELNTDGAGTTVQTSYTNVATIRFTTLNAAGSSNLVWNIAGISVFLDDNATELAKGTFNNLNTSPLPIQLASFNASALSPTQTKVSWSTVSETQNYGFEVQRSANKSTGFASLAGSFVAGHGTTVDQHNYSYIDATGGSGSFYYRLKQIDMDASVHYTEPIQPTGTTDVKDRAPVVFALMQNYPNPFNPTTEIKFSVEYTGRATVRLYNILGAEVATLFDGLAEAGQYYRVRLDGSRLASGVYFYRLESQGKSDLKKMVLLK
jgi:hypothetical protein